MITYYLITSESYSNNTIGDYPMWNNDESHLIISASVDYNYPYSQSFNGFDELQSWIWDSYTKEYLNWCDSDDPDDDPYGIDGPFPEEMDETIV